MKHLLVILLLLPFATFSQVTNDEPCSAISLPILQGPGFCQQTTFGLAGATFNAAFPANGCPFPPTSPTPPDVWFKFAVPAGGSVKISTSIMPGSLYNDCILEAYSTSSDCSGTLTQVGCDDDGGIDENNSMPVLLLSGLQANDTIFLRVMQYNGATNGNFNICVTNPNVPLATKKVGIGLTAPDSTLDVNGHTVVRGGARVAQNLEVGGNTTIQGLAVFNGNIAIAGGSPGVGKVLTSGATGSASWQTPAIQAPVNANSGFSLYKTSNQIIPTATSTKLTWLEIYDDPNAFNTTTSEFTAPAAGLYRFDVQLAWQGGASYSGNKTFQIEIYKNGGQASSSYDYLQSTSLPASQRTGFTLKLASGDKVDIRVKQDTGINQTINLAFTFFTGYRIY